MSVETAHTAVAGAPLPVSLFGLRIRVPFFAATLCALAAFAIWPAVPIARAQQGIEEPVAVERPKDGNGSKPAGSLPAVPPVKAAGDSAEAGAPTKPAPGETAPAPTADPEPKPAPDQEKVDALERIADSLSERMRSLLKRERTLAIREEAITAREEALELRVRAITAREEALEARESLINRREQLPPPQAWEGPKPPDIVGKYAAVIDANNAQFFHLKDAEKQTPVASTQKLLTALIVVQDGDLDREIEVPEAVNDTEPTHVGIKPGQRYTRRDLLRALLIRSGNDVAAALAVDNAGSVEAFAKKMNTFARSLGATKSNFVNPHGLPDAKQVSTARDMALIAFEAYQVPFIRECVNTKTWNFTFNDGSVRTLTNTNKVLRSFEACNGMKTGYTIASGHCLVCSAVVGGTERIVVVIGSNRTYVSKDAQALLEWALNLKMKES